MQILACDFLGSYILWGTDVRRTAAMQLSGVHTASSLPETLGFKLVPGSTPGLGMEPADLWNTQKLSFSNCTKIPTICSWFIAPKKLCELASQTAYVTFSTDGLQFS